jgi:dCMP deaminase
MTTANPDTQLKQQRYNKMWMDMAQALQQLSHCKRKQVGCVVVREGRVISTGWNGTPSGFDNCCEDSLGTTLAYTIHAEANALDKIAKQGGLGAEGANLYVTLQPCLQCSVRILNSGISSVFYRESYRDSSGTHFLETAGIPTTKI